MAPGVLEIPCRLTDFDFIRVHANALEIHLEMDYSILAEIEESREIQGNDGV
jgi:hypothetical protein